MNQLTPEDITTDLESARMKKATLAAVKESKPGQSYGPVAVEVEAKFDNGAKSEAKALSPARISSVEIDPSIFVTIKALKGDMNLGEHLAVDEEYRAEATVRIM